MSVVLTSEEEKLQNEQLIGSKAKHAYEEFIYNFCKEKRDLLFQNFQALPLTAEREMMEVKRMLAAVDTLEDEIITIINTGKLATKQLEKEVKH